MKKLLSLLLALALILTTFASCAKPETALTATELLDLGEKYLLDLDYEQAIVYFNQVIEVEPRNSRAYLGAAEAYVGLGDTESAIDILKTSLDVFVDDEEVTIEILEMLLEIDPTTVEWYLTLAQIYVDRGNTTKAIEILRQGLANASYTDEIEAFLNQLVSNTSDLVETSIVYFDDYNNSISTYEYIYDSNGNRTGGTSVTNVYSDANYTGTVTAWWESEFTCDENGNIAENEVTSDSGGYRYEDEYEYDADGNISKVTRNYDFNGIIAGFQLYYEYEFDSNGNISRTLETYETENVHQVFSDSDGVDHDYGTKETVYEYDENGETTSYTVTDTSTDGTVVTRAYTITREYEYNDDGTVLKCWVTTSYADGGTYSVQTFERLS